MKGDFRVGSMMVSTEKCPTTVKSKFAAAISSHVVNMGMFYIALAYLWQNKNLEGSRLLEPWAELRRKNTLDMLM